MANLCNPTVTLHVLIRHYSAVSCRVLALAVEFDLCCCVKPMCLLCWLGRYGGRYRNYFDYIKMFHMIRQTSICQSRTIVECVLLFLWIKVQKERHWIKLINVNVNEVSLGHIIWFLLVRVKQQAGSLKLDSSILIVLISGEICFPSGNQIRL